MTALEIIGSIALWLIGTYAACLVAAFIGGWFGRDKEMAGLIYAIIPPVIILTVSAVVGLILLGRVSA